MSLLYLTDGERRYGQRRLTPFPRKRWAFQTLFDGNASMLIRSAKGVHEEALAGSVLTVAGPQCVHNWGGAEADRCRVVVFHFDAVDDRVAGVVGHDGYRIVPLTDGEVGFIQQLHDRCAAVARESLAVARLVHQVAVAELSLLLLRRLAPAELQSSSDLAARKVAAAMAWFEANLAYRPTLAQVAAGVHLSPAHLRRLFHQATGCSPHAAFSRTSFERAVGMMHDPALTLEQIAFDVGFGSSSAFSRAFKARFGLSPQGYRERLIATRPSSEAPSVTQRGPARRRRSP
ncbi:MAG TPA: AraC family transcriptional regulator [Chthoniobacteraceae bacterium]|nr:AraC family transcriptional regulator [Chthoniobacteraceae bacterium]